MEDMLSETKKQITARAAALGELLQDHKGVNVSVLDLYGICNWTDFFIITTVSSQTHMDGLERHIRDFCREKEIDILGCSRSRKDSDDEWRLIDLGSIILHLMTEQAREFYDLERLWGPVAKL